MTDEIIETVPELEEVAQEETAEPIESEASEPVTEESEKEPEPEKKPRKDLLERVNQLTKQKHDIARQREEALAEAQYWKEKAQESEGSKRDLAEHEADRAQSKVEAYSKDAWQTKVEIAKAELPDYDEVVTKSKAHVEAHVATAVLESELGPKLFHYLAKNPSELEQLNDMSERGALKQIAKLELMLEQKKAPELKVSKAPEPIKPVTSSRGVVAKQPQDMNIDEYTAWRRANGAKW